MSKVDVYKMVRYKVSNDLHVKEIKKMGNITPFFLKRRRL